MCRKECIFTIDPATARDLDDALSCKQLPDGKLPSLWSTLMMILIIDTDTVFTEGGHGLSWKQVTLRWASTSLMSVILWRRTTPWMALQVEEQLLCTWCKRLVPLVTFLMMCHFTWCHGWNYSSVVLSFIGHSQSFCHRLTCLRLICSPRNITFLPLFLWFLWTKCVLSLRRWSPCCRGCCVRNCAVWILSPTGSLFLSFGKSHQRGRYDHLKFIVLFKLHFANKS